MNKPLAALAIALVSSCVLAETNAFNASITPAVAIRDRDTPIEGLTLSLWGENPQKSLALGVANGTFVIQILAQLWLHRVQKQAGGGL